MVDNSFLLPQLRGQAFCSVPAYLGVKQNRALTYHHHLEALHKKLSMHILLLRQFAGSGWGAGSKILNTATLSLIYSTAEYCAPAWCRSVHTHLIDRILYNILCIVTRCLMSHSNKESSRSLWQVLVLGTLFHPCMNGVLLFQQTVSVALVNNQQTTLFQHVPHIGLLEEYPVGQCWIMKQDAGSTPSLPTFDLGNRAG